MTTSLDSQQKETTNNQIMSTDTDPAAGNGCRIVSYEKVEFSFGIQKPLSKDNIENIVDKEK